MSNKNLKHKFVLQALLSLALASPALALHAQQVSTDYDHKVNFESYHTFSFYKVKTENPLFEQRVRDQVTADLQAHGWQMVPTGGDVAITAIGNVQDQKEYNTFYEGLGPGYGFGGWGGRFGYGGWGGGGFGGSDVSTTRQVDIPVGTLIVDLYDNSTHQLVFRGRSTEQLHVKHEDKNIALVDKSIDKMFAKFPPKADR